MVGHMGLSYSFKACIGTLPLHESLTSLLIDI